MTAETYPDLAERRRHAAQRLSGQEVFTLAGIGRGWVLVRYHRSHPDIKEPIARWTASPPGYRFRRVAS